MRLNRRILTTAGLAGLAALAVFALFSAAGSLKRDGEPLPEEIYAAYADRSGTEYLLKNRDGFIAVYKAETDRDPVSVTSIELAGLRKADRAMIEKGIPVLDRVELLKLLEDLGS